MGGHNGGRPNSLGLNQRQLETLLDKVDRARAHSGASAGKRRKYVRWPFRQATVRVRVTHPGGSATTIHVACRNLSHGGMSLLHSAFLYPGSACTVLLPHPQRGQTPVPATIVRCTHIYQMVHEVGVRFDELIDAREYVSSETRRGQFTVEHVEASDLRGTILYAESAAFDQKLLEHFLRGSGIRIVPACTAAEARRALATRANNEAPMQRPAAPACDLVVCNCQLPDIEGPGEIRELRELAGHEMPFILTVPDAALASDAQVRAARVNALLVKPFGQETLLRALGEFLTHSSAALGESADQGRPAARLALLAEMPEYVAGFEQAVREDDAMACYALALQLTSAAGPLGMAELAHPADAATERLAATMSVRESTAAVVAVLDACKRAVRAEAA